MLKLYRKIFILRFMRMFDVISSVCVTVASELTGQE